MKKKLIALTLCVLTLCMFLAACGDNNAKVKADLTATKWKTEEPLDDDLLTTILDTYYFETEEIALADKADFTLAKEYTFRDDGTALLEYNEDKIYDTFYNGMDHFLSILFAHREELVDVYGEDVTEDEQEFKEFMAWYISDEEFDTVEELLDAFANDIVKSFFSLETSAPMEMTYKIKNGVVEIYDSEGLWDEFVYNADKGRLVSNADGEIFTKAN